MAKIYISGPITSIRGAMDKFDKAEEALKNKGHEVFNPLLITLPKQGEEMSEFNKVGEWVWYMRRCIPELVECDSLLLLPGWQDSRGAKLEKSLAEDLKITIYYNIVEIHEVRKS